MKNTDTNTTITRRANNALLPHEIKRDGARLRANETLLQLFNEASAESRMRPADFLVEAVREKVARFAADNPVAMANVLQRTVILQQRKGVQINSVTLAEVLADMTKHDAQWLQQRLLNRGITFDLPEGEWEAA